MVENWSDIESEDSDESVRMRRQRVVGKRKMLVTAPRAGGMCQVCIMHEKTKYKTLY